MSTQRFTPEFKQEAVRQIVDRGYSVAEVSARLGVSSHSLYRWVRIQPIDATVWWNRSAGVSKFNVFLGRSFNLLATALSFACE